ncbi:MAG: hypothetical protein KDA45_00055 [Planctomycetales bacterium]|nr:hypothetical protein [Planctomycetales bacterium]
MMPLAISGRRPAFSLLELVLATILMAVTISALVAVFRPFANHSQTRAEEQLCELRREQLQLLVGSYQADYGRLPSSDMRELEASHLLGEALPRCPVDQRAFVLEQRSGLVLPHRHR